MPRGPKGEKRPTDVIGNAVHVMRIATGEISESADLADEGKALLRKAGRVGGRARAEKLPAEMRAFIARKAAKARWKSDHAAPHGEALVWL
jgi:hypothetical protein